MAFVLRIEDVRMKNLQSSLKVFCSEISVGFSRGQYKVALNIEQDRPRRPFTNYNRPVSSMTAGRS